MLEVSEQHISLPAHRAPRDGVSSLALVLACSKSRALRQPFATPLVSRRSKIRGGTSLATHRLMAAQSNSFRMTLLYKSQNNFHRDRRPGHIVSRETLLESAH